MNFQESVKRPPPLTLPEGESPAKGSGGPSDTDTLNAFCITLYNEPLESLRSTIGSIVLSEDSKSSGLCLPQTVICVVADGADRLSADIRKTFTAGGVLIDRPKVIDGVEIHASEHSVSELLLLFGLSATDRDISLHKRIRIVFCLKLQNRGKLHSHEVFFRLVCPELDPTFCYQLDAGSILAPDTIAILTDHLLSDPTIGALAPRITPPLPGAFSSMLEAWQYHDFSVRQAVLFPVEGDLELLMCVPGQASVFRWAALKAPTEANGQPSERSPVWAYLFGIAANSPFRQLMYLSEDRVIGFAIVLDSVQNWKLRFAARAGAITDACESLRELLLQRRRWNNSAMVCRLWLLRHWSEVLLHTSRSIGMKTKQSMSMVLQLLLGFREFSAPAQLVAMLLLIHHIGATAQSALPWYLCKAFFCVVAAEISAHIFSVTTKSELQRNRANRLGSALAWTSVTLWISTILIGLPLKAITIVLGSGFLIFLCMVLVLPIGGLPILLRSQFSPVQNLVVSNVILVYSLWNLHDSSWGTKGLTKHVSSSYVARHLHRFKFVVLGACAALNAWLVYSTATAREVVYADLGPLLEITLGIEFLIVSVTLVRHILAKRSQQAPVPTNVSSSKSAAE